jgi:dihydroorotase-like cyclic amidohydrolase
MKILIQGGRVLDPKSKTDAVADVAISAGKIVAIGKAPEGFQAQKTIDAKGCIVMPGLVDLAVRLKEPGHEHEGMLDSELAAAVAGGVTSLVCPPDTDPVLDEPGLVEMLRFKAEKLNRSKVMPLGALTRGLKGEILTEMVQLTEAGCVGFSQAEVAPTHLATPFGCVRKNCIWVKALLPVDPWPRAWVCRAYPWPQKPLLCIPSLNYSKAPKRMCTCAASAALQVWP